jgi:hypothetical protein
MDWLVAPVPQWEFTVTTLMLVFLVLWHNHGWRL